MRTARFGLPPRALEGIHRVLARHPRVERAILYGSRAMGSHKNGSDIDLTLQGKRLSHGELIEIMVELDDLLLPYTIDLSLFHLIEHENLRNHIESAGQEFYRRAEIAETAPFSPP